MLKIKGAIVLILWRLVINLCDRYRLGNISVLRLMCGLTVNIKYGGLVLPFFFFPNQFYLILFQSLRAVTGK